MMYELKRCRRRNPVIWLAMITLAAVLGIGSRRYAHALPGFIAAYAGDTLWALAAFLGFGLILPRVSTRTIAMLALAFSVAVELSQLYHAPWIDSIRHTTIAPSGCLPGQPSAHPPGPAGQRAIRKARRANR